MISEFESSSPITNASSSREPDMFEVAPAAAANSSTWLPVSAPTPWIIPMP